MHRPDQGPASGVFLRRAAAGRGRWKERQGDTGMNNTAKRRLGYLSAFAALLLIEVLIALFVHDAFVRRAGSRGTLLSGTDYQAGRMAVSSRLPLFVCHRSRIPAGVGIRAFAGPGELPVLADHTGLDLRSRRHPMLCGRFRDADGLRRDSPPAISPDSALKAAVDFLNYVPPGRLSLRNGFPGRCPLQG